MPWVADDGESFDSTLYSQCLLRQGNISTVCWLPEVYARVGAAIRVQNSEDGQFGKFWTVAQVWQTVPGGRLDRVRGGLDVFHPKQGKHRCHVR